MKTFGSTMEIDENTGMRVLSFMCITNGMFVNPADLGDEDAMREINESYD